MAKFVDHQKVDGINIMVLLAGSSNDWIVIRKA